MRLTFLLDDDGNPIPVDVTDWSISKVVAHPARRVGIFESARGHGTVSTVFTGVNSHGADPPMVFETLVRGGSMDGRCQRYATREQAFSGHLAMVVRIQALSSPLLDVADQLRNLPPDVLFRLRREADLEELVASALALHKPEQPEQPLWLVSVRNGNKRVGTPIRVETLVEAKTRAAGMLDAGVTLVLAFEAEPDRGKVTRLFKLHTEETAIHDAVKKALGYSHVLQTSEHTHLTPSQKAAKELPNVSHVFHRPRN